MSPADQWKVIRLEQLLDSLSSSIPAPAVVYQQQQQHQPGSHQSAARQFGDDNGALDGPSGSRPAAGLMSVQTRQVSDADADSELAETSFGPRGLQFAPSTELDGAAGKGPAGRAISNNGKLSSPTELAGLVFGKPPGSQRQQHSSAPYYNPRGRGGAAVQQQQRGTGAAAAASSLDELREGSLERPQRRMVLPGSEEVPVQPVQSNSEWESKRVEASPSRWLSFRGMWGKRNVM